ncbi:MAG: FAD-dependent oxidoreductase [Myxococcota bacterium]
MGLTVPDFDVAIIGAGSGGLACATALSERGRRVVLFEARGLGGTCVQRGCVPKKIMHRLAERAPQAVDEALGWKHDASTLNFARFAAARDAYVEQAAKSQAESLHEAGVELVTGRAQWVGAGRVRVDDRTFQADEVVLAAGAIPHRPEAIEGIELASTSEDLLSLQTLPRRWVVLGAGYIGVESASMLAALGCEVVVATHGAVLSDFDPALQSFAADALASRGVRVLTDVTIEAVAETAHGLRVRLSSEEELSCDRVLAALGRRPSVRGVVASEVDIETDDGGAIVIDPETFETSVESVYAIGDIANRRPLTPVARAEGLALAEYLVTGARGDVSLRWVPSAIFALPPMGTVGLTEPEAAATLDEYTVSARCFAPLETAGQDEPPHHEKALVKWVLDGDGRAVGCHLAGPAAAEVIQAVGWAMRSGLDPRQALQPHLRIHPSTTEELAALF